MGEVWCVRSVGTKPKGFVPPFQGHAAAVILGSAGTFTASVMLPVLPLFDNMWRQPLL